MKRYLSVILTVVITLTLIISGCGKTTVSTNSGASTGAPAQKIKLKLASTAPLGNHINEEVEFFKKTAEELSNNRLEIALFPSQQLYNDKDLVEALPKGGVDIAQVNLAMWTGLAPTIGLLIQSGLFRSSDQYYKTLDGHPGQEIVKEIESKSNVKFLAWLDYGKGYYYFTKPVTKIEDWKGLKIRTQADYDGAAVAALGASPVAMSASDVYMALEKKTIDGANSGAEGYLSWKWNEVAKYPMDFESTRGNFAIMMNKNSWDMLPADMQKVIMDAANKTKARSRDQAEKSNAAAFDEMKSKPGVNVVHIPQDVANTWYDLNLKSGVELLEKKIGKDKADSLIAEVKASK